MQEYEKVVKIINNICNCKIKKDKSENRKPIPNFSAALHCSSCTFIFLALKYMRIRCDNFNHYICMLS